MTKRITVTICTVLLIIVAVIFGSCIRQDSTEPSTMIDVDESAIFSMINIDISEAESKESSSELTTEENTTEEETTRPLWLSERADADETTTEAEPEPEFKPEPEIEPEQIAYVEEEDDYDDIYASEHGSYIGQFELTAYEWTGDRMANGEYPYYGACACNFLSLGTRIYIEGYGTFTVCDRGGALGNSVIDIYLGDADACWEFGRKYGVNVYYG